MDSCLTFCLRTTLIMSDPRESCIFIYFILFYICSIHASSNTCLHQVTGSWFVSRPQIFFISTWPKSRCQQWKVFKKKYPLFHLCSQQIFMTRQKQNKTKNRVEMAIRVEMFIATCKLFTMRFFNVKVVSHSTSTVNTFIPW